MSEAEKSEGELLYEQKRKEKEAEDARKLSEAEELLKQERERQEDEIRQLRAKQEARRKQREEEQIRMEERRKAEEARRREEEGIKRRQREEAERALQEERQRRSELELQAQKEGRNHVLVPRRRQNERTDEELPDESSEQAQKTKEELEAEKRAVLSQRIVPLDTSGLDVSQLVEKAKDLHEKLYHLECEKYDLEEGVKRRQYDIMELAEKMRQMNKAGKGKKGTGVEAGYDKIQEKYTQAPPKVEVASKYERKLDRRTFGEKVKSYESFVL